MKEVTLKVRDDIDIVGLFAVIDGKLYAKYGKCDFKDNFYLVPEGNATNKKCRKVIMQYLLNSLELTLKSGLRVGKISYYEKISKK